MSSGNSAKVQTLSFGNDDSVDFSSNNVKVMSKRENRKRKADNRSNEEKYNDKLKEERATELKESKYYHGDGNTMNSKKQNKKGKVGRLHSKLQHIEDNTMFATESAFDAEILLPSAVGLLSAQGLTHTRQIRQIDLIDSIPEITRKRLFNLTDLEYGPYFLDYTKNGRNLLCGGRKGHIAAFDAHKFNLKCEFNVNETIRDVKYLHDFSMYAVAQKVYTYIYDDSGTQLHAMKQHEEASHLDFLPYHYLLVSGSKMGHITYQDTSTGSIVANHRTRKGGVECMRQNPSNAIMHVGHNNGSMSLWSPNVNTPLVQMHCHKATVTALDVTDDGRYMATTGIDNQLHIWDCRTYKKLYSYFTVRPGTCMDFSQTGLLAVGMGPHVQVWKDIYKEKQKEPYMYEPFNGNSVNSLKFNPYEDILGVGLRDRITNLVIPGAGEANFDTFQHNPFETTKQRKERTVRGLVEKIRPEMITLHKNPFGVMDVQDEQEAKVQRVKDTKARLTAVVDTERIRKKGGNKIHKVLARKQLSKANEAREARKEHITALEEKKKADKEARLAALKGEASVPSALNRFKM